MSYRVIHSVTYFITGVGNEKREISLGLVVQALGITRTAVLPGFMYEVVEKPCCQFFLKFIVRFRNILELTPKGRKIVLDVIFRIYYFEVILVKSLFTGADQTSRFARKRKLACWAGAKQISY